MIAPTDTASELMHQSLEAIEDDIVPLFFARFFDGHAGDAEMFHNRRSSEGAMVNEIMTMLLALADGEDWAEMMIRNQVLTHFDHGDIALKRWRDALDLFVDVLASAAGDAWRPEHAAAWRKQADRFYAIVEKTY